MIDVEVLSLMHFDWPMELFCLGAVAFVICALVAVGVLWLIERFAK